MDNFAKTRLLLCAGFLILPPTLLSQAPGSGAVATPAGTQTGGPPSLGNQAPSGPATVANSQSYQASVPQGTASPTPIPLTLGEAIDRGLKANLALLTNEQASRETRADRYRALSGLLPNINGQLNVTAQQINLQALGFLFSLPGVALPHIIGPYSYQDAQANATIPIFDYSAINRFRGSREEVKASLLSIKNARDLVVQAVGNAYLQIIADAARVSATEAEVEADNAVYTNAVRRHEAGVAIRIDVLRAEVELKQRQQVLVADKNQFEKDKLTLGRIIGLPIGQDFTVADPTPSVPLEAISLQDALAKAYANRPDFQQAKARVLAAQFSLRSAKAERYPTLTASGFYGDEGLRLLTDSHGVFQATGSLQFNIFDGGRIKADILENDAELRNRRNELENLRGQIDYDVRTALLDLKSASDQVDVARTNIDLANLTLTQARDRFAAGVTNTVEVVQAQQSVADANENLISAQYQLNVAKVSLARSLGLAEEGMRSYFKNNPGH